MNRISVLLLLRICVLLTFLGRTYEHLRWGVNYREIFWNYKLVGKWVARLSDKSWAEYVSDPTVNANIDIMIQGIGIVFALAGFAALFINQQRKWLAIPIVTGILFYLVLVWLHYFGFVNRLPLALEFSAQIGCSLLLLYAVFKNPPAEKFNLWVKIVVALTFVAHGFYACGFTDRPAGFLNMTMRGFGVRKDLAIDILIIAGILDFVAALGIFLKPAQRIAFAYCILWGFATAFARIYANYYDYRPWASLDQWTWKFLVRTSHYMLPLIGYLIATGKPLSLVQRQESAPTSANPTA